MRTIGRLSQGDHRISQEFENAFPESPEFAAYLSKRLRETNGSVLLARIMIEELVRPFADRVIPIVSAEVVNRLGVDEDIEATQRIENALYNDELTYIFRSIIFGTRLMETPEVPRDAKTMDDVLVAPLEAIDPDQLVAYIFLFKCAQAMLAGVEIDPRQSEAA